MYTCGPWDFGPRSEAHRRQMAKQHQIDADRRDALQDLLGKVGKAALAWRSAEVHLGAIDLGIRDGNREVASDTVDNRATLLRIAVDNLNREN